MGFCINHAEALLWSLSMRCCTMQGLKVFHSIKMEHSIMEHASPAAAMTPAFVDSLNFSSRQIQKLLSIQEIWSSELRRLQAERNSICTSIQVGLARLKEIWHAPAPLP